MAKIISISGTHNTGKTTLLNALKDKGYVVDDFKVSRYVQHKLGIKLSQLSSVGEIKEYQDDVFNEKLLNDNELQHNNKDIIFVERSFVDIIAYTQNWFKKFPEESRWLNDYVEDCFMMQKIYSAVILLHPINSIIFEHDENRGSLESQQEIHRLINESVNFIHTPVLDIAESDINNRIELIENFIKTL